MKIGTLAFLAGLVIAVIGAFVNVSWFPTLLAVLGVIVGILNISGGETRRFLIAAIAFMMSAYSLDKFPMIGQMITDIMHNIGFFVGSATLVVAIKALFELSKD
ncbi:MAG: hypothetical protein OQJ80_02940 [Kangiella sp.]|nr:hypothetical protein [Kangiella sp.]